MSRAPAGGAAALLVLLLAASALGGQVLGPTATVPAAPPGIPAAGTAADAAAGAAQVSATPAPGSAEPGEAAASDQAPVATSDPVPVAAAPATPADLLASTLPLDISTANLFELVDWLRSLSLPEGGSVRELRARLYSHYGVEAPPEEAAPRRTVTIVSASEAVYGEGSGGGGVVRLSGGVEIAIKDGESPDSYSIRARELVYDRDRNTVFAQGDVIYRRTGQGRLEEFRGSSLSADLDDWAGLFLDGVWKRNQSASAKAERGLIFSAATLDKSSGDFFTLVDATVSPSDLVSPYFSIRAARLWFLGGSDWAALSALLYVGEVPLLWIPFFYYPSEEIVFHPVFGYRDREGRFLQTTTYLAGRKPESATGNSILRLAQSSGPLEPRGLFLKRSAETEASTATAGSAGPASSASAPGATDAAAPGAAPGAAAGAAQAAGSPEAGTASAAASTTIKLMADIYTGLGAFVGLDAVLPSFGPLSKTSLSSGLAVSRSLFQVSGSYSPFAAPGAWASVWNYSNFLGLWSPLRFGLSASTGLKLGPFNASVELPLYSDPFFDTDFRNRSEDMDWLKFTQPDDATVTGGPAKRSTFTQKLTLSASLRPSLLMPYVNSANLTKFGSSLSWRSKPDLVLSAFEGASLAAVDPSREFFMPDTLRPIDLSLDFAGNLFEAPAPAQAPKPAAASKPAEATKPKQTQEAAPAAREPSSKDQAPKPGLVLRSPWADEAGATEKIEGATEVAGQSSFPAPPLAPGPGATTSSTPFSAKLAWTFQPGLFVERRFLTDSWTGATEIDYAPLYDLLSWRVGAGLNSSFTLASTALTGGATLAYSDQDQVRAVTDAPSFAATKASLVLSDAKFARRRLSGSLKLSSKPFPAGSLFDASSLSWNLDALLYSRAYDPLSGSTPAFKESFVEWSKDYITADNLGLSLATRVAGQQQSLSLTVNLPPMTEAWAANLALGGNLGGWKLSFGAQERATRSLAGVLEFGAFSANVKATTPVGLTFSDALVYDFSKGWGVSNSASLAWDWFSATLQAQRTRAFEPILGTGWKVTGEDAFRPTSFVLAMNPKYTPDPKAVWRPSWGLNLNYNQGLLKFTDSTLGLGVTAGIAVGSGFTVSLATQSQNRNVWRYFPGLFPAVAKIGDPESYRLGLLEDIANSLTFWDSGARSRGSFKLKSLSLRLSQDLVDWLLSIEASASPKLDTEKKLYFIDPKLSLAVSWKDIPEMKSAVNYQNSTLSW